jgi:Domain of unknown function (DUF4783)
MKSRFAGRAFLVVLALTLFSFRPFYSIDAVTSAIRSGDVALLSPYLDYRVDISLRDKSDTYSKTQAEMVISDFFTTNGVRNFRITQKTQNNGSLFCAGILVTNSGNYRTSLFLKQKGDREYVEEIRFQEME